MEHFREVQDGIFLLKSPFPPVWSGVTLVRGEELCLIDSGASADVADGVIRPALAELGLGLGDIDWLVSTHCHGDHIGGHARIKELAPQIRTACIEQAAPALRDPAANAVRIRTKYPRFSPPPQCYLRGVEPDRILRDGEALGDRLTVLHTPGHDGDCVCWYDRKTKTAVTGDSLQANGTVTQGIAFYQDAPREVRAQQPNEEAAQGLCADRQDLLGFSAWFSGISSPPFLHGFLRTFLHAFARLRASANRCGFYACA